MHPGVTAGHPRLRLGPPASVLAASLYYSGPRAPGRPNLEPCGRAPSIALPARTASGEPRRRRCTLTTSPGCSECPTSAPSSVTSSGASSTPLTVRRRWPPRVGDAGGKRLRPALTIACAGLGGIYDQRVVAAATAAELVQVGSLVHDDLLDGALTRRGTPTINAVEGASTALLAGDFMLAQAGQLAAGVGAGAASILAMTISELCIGQTREMAQLSDPDRTIDEHLESIRGKTAMLFRCACLLGALCAELADDQSESLEGADGEKLRTHLTAGDTAAAITCVIASNGVGTALGAAETYARSAATSAESLQTPSADALAALAHSYVPWALEAFVDRSVWPPSS